MKRRLTIITEIIAPYRIPVFNALARHPEIDLSVIFLAETDPSIRQWRVYADEIRFCYEVQPSWRKRLGRYNLLLNQNVTEALEAANPDAILCGGYNYLASWQAQHWAVRAQVPFLLWSESTISDQRNRHGLVESLKQNFISRCDGFVVPGTSARNYIQWMNAGAANIFVAPNAVDNELFANHSNSARVNAWRLKGELGLPSRYFLFAGRLLRQKGVLNLLEAYASLADEIRERVGLVFAGDGPMRAELESLARTVFPGTVHFPGFLHRDQLATYYALAECFVFPTLSDPWALVVNEAMACGLPVICSSAAGCAADLVKDNGICVEHNNVFQLADAMERISNDPALRSEMTRQSKRIISDYSPESCAAGIAEAALAMSHEGERANPSRIYSRAQSGFTDDNAGAILEENLS